jgi:hypothetical protein
VPDALTRSTLADLGASVLFTTPTDIDRGGTRSCVYFATR